MVVPVAVASLPAPARIGPDVATSPIAWKAVSGVKTGDRPLAVWIADSTTNAAAEHGTFDDTDVRLAARAFRVVRISPREALADRVLSPYVGFAPALLVLSPDLARGTLASGPSLEPRSVLAQLRSAATTYERVDLDRAIVRARAILAEQQALESEKTALERTPAPDKDAVTHRARIGAISARLSVIRTEFAGLFRA